MRKVHLLFAVISVTLSLCACGSDEPDIPSLGEETTERFYDTEAMPSFDPIDDYTEYHRAKGFYIFKSDYDAQNKEYSSFYDYTSLDGYYDHLVDAVYAATLNLKGTIREGKGSYQHETVVKELELFLNGKTASALHPEYNNPNMSNAIDDRWIEPLNQIFNRFEERALADTELYALLRLSVRYQITSFTFSGLARKIDYVYSTLPSGAKHLIPADVDVASCGVDENIGCKYYEFTFPEGCDVVVKTAVVRDLAEDFKYIFSADTDDEPIPEGSYVRIKKGERFYLHPSFEGWIVVAAINDDGVLGKSTVIEAKSVMPELAEAEIVFKSETLEKAVRQYLGKDENAVINTTELKAVTHVCVNGDSVYVGTELPDASFMDLTEKQKESDFSFEDMDFFYGLQCFFVKNLQLSVLPQGKYLKAGSITVSNCGLQNIDAVRYSIAEYIDFSFNELTDASALQYASYVKELYLNDNRELELIKLPHQHISLVNRKNTKVKSRSFTADAVKVNTIR